MRASGSETRPGSAEASDCRCRYCGRMVAHESQEWRKYQPFCSERCRLADLDRWFEGEYRIPGGPIEDDAAEEPPQ